VEPTFVLRRDELTIEFIEVIKNLFKDEEELQITVIASEDFGLNQPEDRNAYWARFKKDDANVESKTQIVEISEIELDDLAHRMLQK